MSDLISRKYLLSKIKGKCTDAETQGYVDLEDIEDAPSADIMECARAMKNACGKIDCAFCPINYWCGVEDIRPFDWNLPEGEKGGNDDNT